MCVNFRLQLFVLVQSAQRKPELRCVDVRALHNNPGDKRYTVIHAPGMPSDARALACSNSDYLVVVGASSLCVVKLPTSVLDRERMQDSLHCSAINVGAFFSHGADTVVQASWHPLSERHLVVLWSNGTLQLYNVEGNREVPEQGPSRFLCVWGAKTLRTSTQTLRTYIQNSLELCSPPVCCHSVLPVHIVLIFLSLSSHLT